MSDHSADMADKDCLGAIYGAERPVYAGSGWTAVRDQVAREPDENNAHWVEQTAVLYPSAEQAQSFFHDSQVAMGALRGELAHGRQTAGRAALWRSRRRHRGEQLDYPALDAEGPPDEWACHHALSVVSNLTVETCACGYSIRDEAATMANKMIANAI